MSTRFNQELFHGRYTPGTSRAGWCDYYEGIYHIIIVTSRREHYFGEIIKTCSKSGIPHNEMHLSETGKFAYEEIPKIMEHYPYVYILEWTVMPDHIHVIIMIGNRDKNDTERHRPDITEALSVESLPDESSQDISPMASISPKKGSVSVIIRQFKRAVTMFAKINKLPFKWQSRFYDVILHNQADIERTQEYIKNNVKNWDSMQSSRLPDFLPED